MSKLALVLVLLAGAIFRLGWGADIEYKDDERFNFEVSQRADGSEALPPLGMNSGQNLPNPGLSVWVFTGLARLTSARTPVDLARAVQMLNVVALLLLAVLIFRYVPPEERETWLWGLALACVNPIDVLLQRKIWAPAVFPIVTTLMMRCWWQSRRFWWAVGWGLIAALLGQIQMAGFAFALSFTLGTLVLRRRDVNWLGWLLGSTLGLIPLSPWLEYVWAHRTELGGASRFAQMYLEFSMRNHPLTGWIDWVRPQVPLVWITNSLGLDLDYSLFSEVYAFLRYPYVGELPTYGVLGAMLVSIAIAAVILTRALAAAFAERRNRVARGPTSAATLGLAIAFVGFGGLVALTTYFVQRHYLLMTFPYEFIGLAWVTRYAFGHRPRLGRIVLGTLCVAQFILTASFLGYIHVNHGAPGGDFGVTYGAQPKEN